MHAVYGGVVPELASRDHVRRLLPLAREASSTKPAPRSTTSTSSPTRRAPASPARCWWAPPSPTRHGARARHAGGRHPSPRRPPAVAAARRAARRSFRSSRCWSRAATRSSCACDGVGDYALLGETQDDAAGEAFDKTATLLGLAIPAGPRSPKLARARRRRHASTSRGRCSRSGDLDFSFSGLKTAVLTRVREPRGGPDEQRAPTSRARSRKPSSTCSSRSAARAGARGLTRLVVAGGVGANRSLARAPATRDAAARARRSTSRRRSSAPTTAR